MAKASLRMQRAQASDLPALAAIGAATFTETFGHLYASEDLNDFLETNHSVDSYRSLLAESDVAVWIVHDGGGQVIGYGVAGPNTIPIECDASKPGEIRRLYFSACAQGYGFGTTLLTIMLNWLTSRDFDCLYISVYSDNIGAQRLYARHGFSKVGEYAYMVGSHADREFIMRRDVGK